MISTFSGVAKAATAVKLAGCLKRQVGKPPLTLIQASLLQSVWAKVHEGFVQPFVL